MFVSWWIFGGECGLIYGLIMVVFVFIIVCLCVFGLVMLIVIMVGIGLVVCYGIFIKGGEVLECVYFFDIIVFDKIGMFIEGKFFVMDVVIYGEFSEIDVFVFVVVVEYVFEYLLVWLVVDVVNV